MKSSASESPDWLDWAKELQFIAQAGLTYSKDPFDLERFQRIRDISAEITSRHTGLPYEQVRHLFCSEVGFQTHNLEVPGSSPGRSTLKIKHLQSFCRCFFFYG